MIRSFRNTTFWRVITSCMALLRSKRRPSLVISKILRVALPDDNCRYFPVSPLTYMISPFLLITTEGGAKFTSNSLCTSWETSGVMSFGGFGEPFLSIILGNVIVIWLSPLNVLPDPSLRRKILHFPSTGKNISLYPPRLSDDPKNRMPLGLSA
jgi:hypothetical protein